MSLYANFLDNREKRIHKWTHYFPIYERHFSGWRDRTLLFLEIGVFGGGSLQMWHKYFGPRSTILGIDINPACKKFDSEATPVRIGDQIDPDFLASVIQEFGVPDIVLDDGSHRMQDINASFDFLYSRMGKNGVYMVEDLHTAYWPNFGGGVDNENTFINRTKGFIDQLHAHYTEGAIQQTEISRNTMGISVYDSIVVLERGGKCLKQAVITGPNQNVRSASTD